METLGPAELLIILAIVLLVFGSSRLPKLARSLGEAAHEFRRGHDAADADAVSGAAVHDDAGQDRGAEQAAPEEPGAENP